MHSRLQTSENQNLNFAVSHVSCQNYFCYIAKYGDLKPRSNYKKFLVQLNFTEITEHMCQIFMKLLFQKKTMNEQIINTHDIRSFWS